MSANNAPAAGSACRFQIVATTSSGIRTFEGNAAAKPGQRTTLDVLLISLISGIVREENLDLQSITIDASMEEAP